MPQKKKGKQGFASMDPERRRQIASMGGRAQGKHNNPGNFANNAARAALAGSLGGHRSRGGGRKKLSEPEKQA